jgi:hypothetical protein
MAAEVASFAKLHHSQKLRDAFSGVLGSQDSVKTTIELFDMKATKALIIWLEELSVVEMEITPAFLEILRKIIFGGASAELREAALRNLAKASPEDVRGDIQALASQDTFFSPEALDLLSKVVCRYPEILKEFYPVIFRTFCEVVNEPEILQASSLATLMDDLLEKVAPDVLVKIFGTPEFLLLLVLSPNKMDEWIKMIARTPELEQILRLSGYKKTE